MEQAPITSQARAAPAPWAVGVVLWNNRDLLPALRDNLRALSPRPAAILVLDNGSADGSADWVGANWPEANLTRSKENLGFAEGHNRLIAEALSDSRILGYLALNSDALLENDFLEIAPASLNPNQRIGSLQPLVRRLDANMQRTNLIDTTGIGFNAHEGLFLDRHAGEEFDPARHEIPGEVFGCSGAVALYHRTLLEEVHELATGYFDRRFFAYYEDVDLAWRAQRHGWRCVYEPRARAWHRRYGSMRSSPQQEKLLYRNRLWLHAKNEGGRALTSPKQILREGANLLRAITTRRYLWYVLPERFREAANLRKEFDRSLPRINLRDFSL